MFRALSWLGVFTGVPSLAVWLSSFEMSHSAIFFAFSVLALGFTVFSCVLAIDSRSRRARPDVKIQIIE